MGYWGLAFLGLLSFGAFAAPVPDYNPFFMRERISPAVPEPGDFARSFNGFDGKEIKVVVRRPTEGKTLFFREPNENEDLNKYFQAGLNAVEDETKLVFPPGSYQFPAGRRNSGRRRAAYLLLRGAKNLKVVGDGVEIRLTTPRPFLRLQDCERVEITGFTVNYNVRLASLATIGTHQGRRFIKVDPEYLPSVKSTPLYQKVAAIYQRNKKDSLLGKNPFRHRSTHRVLNKTFDIDYTFDESVGGFLAPLGNTRLNKFEENDKVFIKHTYREGTAFTFRGNSDITLSNITTGSIPGLFMAGTNWGRGLLVTQVKTGKSPHAPLEVIALGAAGANIIDIEGDVAYVGNDIWGANDDGFNVHGSTLEVVSSDEETLEVESTVNGVGLWTLEPNEKLILMDRRYAPVAAAVVKTATPDFDNGKVVLKLDRKLTGIKEGFFVQRPDKSGRRFVFLNNRIRAAHGRGILIQAANGLIKNNRLVDLMDAGIALGAEVLRWRSGGAVLNARVVDNYINRVGTCHFGFFSLSPNAVRSGAISIGAWIDYADGYFSNGRVNRFIEISNNRIYNIPLNGVRVGSATRIKVANNYIKDANQVDPEEIGTGGAFNMPPHGGIFIHHSNEVTGLATNEFVGTTDEVFFHPTAP